MDTQTEYRTRLDEIKEAVGVLEMLGTPAEVLTPIYDYMNTVTD